MNLAKRRLNGPRTGPSSEGAGVPRYLFPKNSSRAFDERIDDAVERAVRGMGQFVQDSADIVAHGFTEKKN